MTVWGQKGQQWFYAFWQGVVDFIYPPLCILCRNNLTPEEKLVCQNCWDNLPTIESSNQDHLWIQQKKQKIYFEGFYACFQFSPEMQILIHQFKYKRKLSLGRKMGETAAKLLTTEPAFNQIDCILPVPLHRRKLRERGYNQSWEIVYHLSVKSGIPCSNQILRRIRYTSSQTELDAEARVKNVANAFVVPNPALVQNRNFLIVDDLITTGSTLNACAKALAEAGANRIWGLAIARP